MNMKELDFGDAALQRMLEGVDILGNAAALTLGPRGRHVVIERPGRAPEITRDGATVAAAVSLPGPVANLGAELLREAARLTHEDAGDGTTTAIVLARAMIAEGLKSVAVGISPAALRAGIESAITAAEGELDAMVWPCVEPVAIERVALVSVTGDAELARLLTEAMQRAGRDGTVLIEDGRSVVDELQFVDGARVDSGYLSASFVTDSERNACVLEHPLMVFVDARLSTVTDVLCALECAFERKRPLLLLAEDVSGEALATLVTNAAQGILQCCAVRVPGVGEDRAALLDDLAILSGATVCSTAFGMTPADLPDECFGSALRVEIDARRCVIVGGEGDAATLVARIGELRRAREACAGETEREQFDRRLARLSGGVAVLRLGAASETSMLARKVQADDALRAMRAAMEGGLVPGGGVALLNCRGAVTPLLSDDIEAASGVRVVLRALEEPLRCISANAGAHPSVVIDAVTAGSPGTGFDAESGECVDVVARGIVDPLLITRCALRNAASVAVLMLTSTCTVTRLVAKPISPLEGSPS